MSNPLHLAILQEGVAAWNQWRIKHPCLPDLKGANLSGIDLAGAILGATDLSHADLSHANLSAASLHGTQLGQANLSHANLNRADLSQVDLSGADLSQADLSQANLSQARMNQANLIRANFSAAKLQGIDAGGSNFSYAHLTAVDLSYANLARTNLSRTNLSSANLSYANLLRARLREADLSYTNFSHANCFQAIFAEHLRGATIRGTNFTHANLRETFFVHTFFNGADLSDADLTDADLTGTSFRKTALKRARLMNCTFEDEGAALWHVDLTEASGTEALRLHYENIACLNPHLSTESPDLAYFLAAVLYAERLRKCYDYIGPSECSYRLYHTNIVLIIGCFPPQRSAILDALRTEVRHRGYEPVFCDGKNLAVPSNWDAKAFYHGTNLLRSLVHLSEFVLVDLTDLNAFDETDAVHDVSDDPRLENVGVLKVLEDIIAFHNAPIQLLLDEEKSATIKQMNFSKYRWVLPPFYYRDQAQLQAFLREEGITTLERAVSQLEQAGDPF